MSASAAISRRRFLTGVQPRQSFRPRPPAVTEASVLACTGCGECVQSCPEQILVLFEERVTLDLSAGECTFCGACAEACPEAVFTASPGMAHDIVIGPECLAQRGVSCMACRDACPEEAISLRPRIGGPFLPFLDQDRCIGCGACVAPCPADAIVASRKGGAHA